MAKGPKQYVEIHIDCAYFLKFLDESPQLGSKKVYALMPCATPSNAKAKKPELLGFWAPRLHFGLICTL